MDNSKTFAFPKPVGLQNGELCGLTKLEYLSSMALQGILSCDECIKAFAKLEQVDNKSFHEHVPKLAIKMAKELLKQLEQEK